MADIVVINHVTLDGVMQGPGRAEEDTSGDFAAGGWAAAGVDEVLMTAMNARVAEGGGMRLLLGRRSYEGMLGYWNTQDSPFKDGLNNTPKYVASTTLREPLPWPNSTLLADRVPDRVAALKKELEGGLFIMGSGELIQNLLTHRLIDEFMLFVHPLVLGTGRRIFPQAGTPTSLRLLDSKPTTTGVIVAGYRFVTCDRCRY